MRGFWRRHYDIHARDLQELVPDDIGVSRIPDNDGYMYLTARYDHDDHGNHEHVEIKLTSELLTSLREQIEDVHRRD